MEAQAGARAQDPEDAHRGQDAHLLVDKQARHSRRIRLGLIGIGAQESDYARALVMNQILGGSFRRLTLNLRETKGWTYGVASMFEARRTPGPWTAGANSWAEHTADSVTEILKEIVACAARGCGRRNEGTKDEMCAPSPRALPPANQVAGANGGAGSL